jgi:hypothetical protein
MSPLLNNRMVKPTNSSNQLWMAYKRYINGSDCENPTWKEVYHSVCELWNATYEVDLKFQEGKQNHQQHPPGASQHRAISSSAGTSTIRLHPACLFGFHVGIV